MVRSIRSSNEVGNRGDELMAQRLKEASSSEWSLVTSDIGFKICPDTKVCRLDAGGNTTKLKVYL